MTKLILLAAVVILGCKFITGRWPWDIWGAGNSRGESDRARALLGVTRAASHGEIIEAHKRLVARVHPDKGGTNEQVHEANRARDLLLAQLLERGGHQQ